MNACVSGQTSSTLPNVSILSTGFPVPPLPHTGPTANGSCAHATVVLHWSWAQLPTRTDPAHAAASYAVCIEQNLHVLKVRPLCTTHVDCIIL